MSHHLPHHWIGIGGLFSGPPPYEKWYQVFSGDVLGRKLQSNELNGLSKVYPSDFDVDFC